MGKKLFAEVTEMTGLPEALIGEELKSLLDKKGIAPEQMTLESLREALSDYLTELNVQMQAAEASDSTVALSAAFHAELRSIKAPTQ